MIVMYNSNKFKSAAIVLLSTGGGGGGGGGGCGEMTGIIFYVYFEVTLNVI